MTDKTNGEVHVGDELPEPVQILPAQSHLKFVETSLADFHQSKIMWAANYFVLWPLGLALTVTSETDEAGVKTYTKLDVREWTYPDGELTETINQDEDENQADYAIFLAGARERILAMKPEERVIALHRLAKHEIATAVQMIASDG